MHVIPFSIGDYRPDQVEEFLLAHEWLHLIYQQTHYLGG